MQTKKMFSSRLCRRLTPLAAAVLFACSQSATANPNSTVVVQNCSEHGTGSLRTAVSGAASGSTIDLSQLTCSTITLSTGAIEIPQSSLSFSGPGASKLTINGGAANQHYNRILDHKGTGQLTISGLTLTGAMYEKTGAEALGGCVLSFGSVVISASTLTGCYAISTAGNDAKGGAISAPGLTLLNSSITNNVAYAAGTGDAIGGGIYNNGALTIKDSTISYNFAAAPVGTRTDGGGISSYSGDVMIFASTIANNYSEGGGGGILIKKFVGDPAHTAIIVNSTISSNRAKEGVGGLVSQNALTLANSTIAFNNAETGGGAGAGLEVQASLDLQSSIIAANSSDLGDDDFYSSEAVTGANNLVTTNFGSTNLPADTITACPLLGRLSDNGGPTLTHRLLTNSPALDAGNNITGFQGNTLMYDQRGTGHPRTYNNVTDIGAFEYGGGTADEIFRSGFEGRCR